MSQVDNILSAAKSKIAVSNESDFSKNSIGVRLVGRWNRRRFVED